MIKNEPAEKSLFEAIDRLAQERYYAKDIQDLANSYIKENVLTRLNFSELEACKEIVNTHIYLGARLDDILRVVEDEFKNFPSYTEDNPFITGWRSENDLHEFVATCIENGRSFEDVRTQIIEEYEKKPDILYSGTYGECSWNLSKDGKLTIYPTNGEEGVLANTSEQQPPWNEYSNMLRFVYVEKGVKANKDASGLFQDAKRFAWMGCSPLRPFVENGVKIDLKNLDTSNVENMRNMFAGVDFCDVDFSNFDTSNVTNMAYMFEGSRFKNLDLSNFNTSKVTDMSSMFKEVKTPSLDLSSFNTSNVTNMGCMFYSTFLEKLDLSHFNTSKVTTMQNMFADSLYLESLNLSGFDTSNTKNMISMFSDCWKLESLDLSSFNTSNDTDERWMFKECRSLKELNLGDNFLESQLMGTFAGVPQDIKIISSNVDAINLGFKNKTIYPENDKNLVASGTHGECSWDIEKDGTLRIYPTNGKEGMLANTSVFEEIPYAGTPLPPWVNKNFEPNGVKKVIVEKGVKTNSDATGLFSYLPECKEMDISNLDTSRATSMYDMFWGCSSLTSLDVSNFDVRSVTEMSHIFASCDSLKELNLGDRFLESQLAHAKAFEWGTPSDLKIISSNVDAINLGLKNETIRPESPNKSTKEAWKPKPKKEEKLPFKVKVKTKSTKSSNFDDVKI